MSLDIAYFSFNPRRADEHWKNFSADTDALRSAKNSHDSLFELQAIDTNYGCVESESFLDNDMASFIMEDFLPRYLNLPTGEVSSSDLVKLYNNLNKESLEQLVTAFSKDTDFDDTESAIDYITDFFKCMKPVVQDFKNNPDSVLVLLTAGYDEFTPKSSAEILENRARKHMEEFKDILVK
ncbi:MAG: hypothetical protein PHG25_02120 [Candidatus Pacebacteria bacterium]|nr:hypothetical protein [Candidatus Paceibacterota bacterium]